MSPPSIDLTVPFRGSCAVAAGLLTRRMLRGPRFQRVFPDIYAPAGVPPDLTLRSRAAAVLVDELGVVAGYAAAELLGASCGPADAPATVIMSPGRQRRTLHGLEVRRDRLAAGETTDRHGVLLTSPARTAYDLARWEPTLVEKVVAIDAITYGCRLAVDDVRAVVRFGGQHTRGLEKVLRLADGLAESPMESRIRMALFAAGLPRPELQFPIPSGGVEDYRLDLAYPGVLLAIEYDGGDHRKPERAIRDLRREAVLTRLGWTVLRFDAATVLRRPWWVAQVVRRELAARGVHV